MAWKKGQSGNPAGREPGIPTGRNACQSLVIRVQNARDPKKFLQAVMATEGAPLQVRTFAANSLMPYDYCKLTDPPITADLGLVLPKTAADAEDNIALINFHEAKGRITSPQAESLRRGQQAWLEAHIISSIQIDAKAALKAMEGGQLAPKLIVQSSMPDLPLDDASGPIVMPGRGPLEPEESNPWASEKDQK